jgi:PilZ domain
LHETLVPLVDKLKSAINNVESLDRKMMNSWRPGFALHVAAGDDVQPHREVRCAVRFPLSLPVELSSARRKETGVTRNISASGVLFELDRRLRKGSNIRFSLRMPSAVLGTPQDVLVQCAGRVVRCSVNQDQYLAAATIDEYRFIEQ